MNKVAIAFLTKDRVELSRQTVQPLLLAGKFDLHWFDGSTTREARRLLRDKRNFVHLGVVGGADTAVVFALTRMLEAGYEFVGLVENDVLLDPDWFEPAMALFDKGAEAGLAVGCVSARSYEDRILVQRNGYALCHNLGWGTKIFSRAAAQLTLKHLRSGLTAENRRIFSQLTNLDIGNWWAFRTSGRTLVPDWHNDAMLASHGLASLALTPAKCQMIGQVPPLEQQGLRLVTKPIEPLRNDKAFETFVMRTARIRNKELLLPCSHFQRAANGHTTIFPHQLREIGAHLDGDWTLKWNAGFGPFAWRAKSAGASFEVPIIGAVDLLLSGGENGSTWEFAEGDNDSATSQLPPEGRDGRVLSISTSQFGYRTFKVSAVTPGGVFYELVAHEPQAVIRCASFDHSFLPPVE